MTTIVNWLLTWANNGHVCDKGLMGYRCPGDCGP
jgi:hypothetical protein